MFDKQRYEIFGSLAKAPGDFFALGEGFSQRDAGPSAAGCGGDRRGSERRMRDTAEYRDEVCRDLAEQTRRYGYLDAHCIRALYEGFNEKIMELNREKMRLAAQRIKLCEASSRSAAG